MKKIFIPLFLVVALNVYSQNGPPWMPTGNTASAGEFIGTTNNFSLDFRTNNVQQMSLGTNGILKLNSLNGIGNRILLTDATGNITALPQGGQDQYLLSDGTWGNLPLSVTLWKTIGNDLSFQGGNLGIGTTSPSYKLDVLGDARISNNLYVGGGIVVTDKLDASIEVKAGDVKVNHDLTVAGNTKLAGVLTAQQGILFDAANNLGIGFTPATGTTSSVFRFGNPTMPAPIATCMNPNINTYPGFVFNGHISATANNGPVNSVLNVLSAPWNGSGYVEVEGTDELGGTNNAFFINYFCGRNTMINVNNGLPNGGGTIFMGSKVDMAGSVKVGWSGNTTFDPNTSMEFYNASNANWNGIKFNTSWGGAKVISINNSNFPVSPFTLFADGRVNLSTVAAYNNQKVFSIDNAANTVFEILGNGKTSLSVDPAITNNEAFQIKDISTNMVNFKVKATGVVYAREINVLPTTQNFPDYVFEKSYKLLTISELDNYIKTNKHLPGFKKGVEYDKEGLNVSELLLKQQEKIEELALYIIELKKEVDALKSN